MPTSEANTSALKKTNTARGKDELESFKANVSIMTQDQCLDNEFQTKSNNNRSLSDKVSDDLKKSKNNFVSNGVSSVQEFNINVDSEHRADSMAVDANSSLAGKVLPTSKRFSETPSNFVDPKEILDNSIHNVVAEKGECVNNIKAAMTVITHQNSNENIRDIIANSEQTNKNSSDSQLTINEKSVKNERNHFNPISSNKSSEIRRNRKLIRSENINECEDDKPEDPIKRLNKLRASISSALSEVKGVLKQYSTEQNCEGQNESTPSNEPPDDGPVRFRFVRKIRRRSAFSEDDESEIPKTFSDTINSPIVENKTFEEVSNELKDNSKVSSNENLVDSKKDINTDFKEVEKPIQNANEESYKKLVQVSIEHVPQGIGYGKDNESEIQKTILTKAPCAAETPKIKNGKTKKVLKKDRRASIAAVEINQISNDQLPKQLELKTQRRPSDSGTIVKQPTRVKVKISEKSKPPLHLKTKTDSAIRSTQTVKADKKIDVTLSPIKDQSTSPNIEPAQTIEIKKIDAAIIENLPVAEARVSVTSATPLQSTEGPPSFVEINTREAGKVLTSLATVVSSAKGKDDATPLESTEAPPSFVEINTREAGKVLTSLATVVSSAKGKDDATPLESTEAPPSFVEINTREAGKVLTSPATLVSSAKVKDDLSQIIPKTIHTKTSTTVEHNSNNVTIDLQPSFGTTSSIESNKTEISKKPTTISTQLIQDIKTGTPSKDFNMPIASKSAEIVGTSKTAKADPLKPTNNQNKILAARVVGSLSTEFNKNKDISTEAEKIKTLIDVCTKSSKTMQNAETIVPNKKPIESDISNIAKRETGETSKKAAKTLTQINEKSSGEQKIQLNESSDASEPEEPKPLNVPKDALAVKFNLPGQESVEELQRLEKQQEEETSPSQTSEPQTSDSQTSEAVTIPPKKKRKAKRKVVIRRIKRKLSKDDTFLHPQEAASQLEICEKEIEEKDLDEEPEAEEEAIEVSKTPKSCLKLRQFEIGDVVMYAEHYKKTQVRWKKAVVTERITSISYKLNIEGEERPAHISYIKKFTDRKVNFGGKEYLEIDYAQIEEDEEKERNYSIWNLV